jgi:rare lipoprotein A
VLLAVSTQLGRQDTGTAVYYSDRYEGRPMANGEIFDQEKLTASHKSYPFDSRVRVTNLANNESVVVRVTDRPGPASKALIELTRAGAEKLGYLGEGTAQVRVELLEREGQSGDSED